MSAIAAVASAEPLRRPHTPERTRKAHPTLVEPVVEAEHGVATQITAPNARFVQSLALLTFEIIEGTRSIGQLGQSVTLGATRQIAAYRAARCEQRKVLGLSPLTVHHVGRVRIDQSQPRIIEAAAVVFAGKRARAVAIRLEWQHYRWRATDVIVL